MNSPLWENKLLRMRFKIEIFLAITIFLLIFKTFAQTGVTKRALIFAIANYPADKGWPTLSSLADAQRMKATLMHQGFDSSQIVLVQDSGATVDGISNAFNQLMGKIKSGDIVVIHFSCHGERVKSNNDNKLEGLDECVVSFDAIAPTVSTNFEKDQAEYYRGYQLGNYILQLREKLGEHGDLMVFLDYCHSGSGTRGLSVVRGGKLPFVPKGDDPSRYIKSDSSGLARQLQSSYVEKNLSPFVVFSATKPDESDMETADENGQGIGSLTYAVSKSFESIDAGMTYRSFFANIQTIMNIKVPGQHPLMEGNGADRIMLGGIFKEQKPFFEIQKILKGNQLMLNAGLSSGLDTGMEVALFPKGTSDPQQEEMICSGKIIQSENFSSRVLLSKDPGISQPSAGWVFVTNHHYRVDPISVYISPLKTKKNSMPGSEDWLKNIKSILQEIPFVTFDGSPELVIAHGVMYDSIKIASNGYLFSKIKIDNGYSKNCRQIIQQYTQYKFLQQLKFTMEGVSMQVQLVPVIRGRPDIGKTNSHLVNGLYEFTDHDTVVLLITNTGQQDAYINILDMQPDGVINAVLPNRIHSILPYDLKLRAGESRLLTEHKVIISPPYGTEVFKIFVSPKEMDMETIAQSRGESGREDLSLLEKLVQNSYEPTRGDDLNSKRNNDGTTYNLIFSIKPAK